MDLLRDLFEVILNYFGFEQTDAKQFAAIVFGILILTGILIQGVKIYISWRRVKQLENDLHPYFSKLEITRATKYYVPTNCQNIAPSQEHEPKQSHAFVTKQRLIPFVLNRFFDNTNDQRFYLILADSGMGKTTFLINLYLKYINKFSLNKKFTIRIYPLAYPHIVEKVKEINDKRNTILLLDAFDEDPKAVADYENRIKELIEEIKEFRIVIITCRTQFFPTEEKELKETGIMKFGVDKGYHSFYKLYISPFDDEDISYFLAKKYNFFKFFTRYKAKKIVRQSPNLMVRPMLLNYIDDLIKFGGKLNYTYQIYEILIESWVEREAKRVEEIRKNDFKSALQHFSREMALYLYANQTADNNLVLNQNQLILFKDSGKINLESWEMTGRSLLNRNAIGQYKFSHKSILEYLLAVEFYERKNNEISNLKSAYDFSKFILLEFLHKLIISHSGEFRTESTWFGIEYLNTAYNTARDISKYNLFLADNEISQYSDFYDDIDLIYKIRKLVLTRYIKSFPHNNSSFITINRIYPYSTVYRNIVLKMIFRYYDYFFFPKKSKKFLEVFSSETALSGLSFPELFTFLHLELICNESTSKMLPLLSLTTNLISLKISSENITYILDCNAISKITNLKILEFRGGINLINIDALEQLDDLEFLILSIDTSMDFIKKFNRLKNLRYLVLFNKTSNLNVDERENSAIKNVLLKNPNLTIIYKDRLYNKFSYS